MTPHTHRVVTSKEGDPIGRFEWTGECAEGDGCREVRLERALTNLIHELEVGSEDRSEPLILHFKRMGARQNEARRALEAGKVMDEEVVPLYDYLAVCFLVGTARPPSVFSSLRKDWLLARAEQRRRYDDIQRHRAGYP